MWFVIRPLTSKYDLESKYVSIYLINIFYWILLKPDSIAHIAFPTSFSNRYLPRNCVAVFQWNFINWYVFSQQTWQASKIPSCFWRLVHTMECLMTCIVRLSGIVRQWTNPSWSRKMTVKMTLSYTHTRTSCVHSKWKPDDNLTLLFGMWHKIHYIWLIHVNLVQK